MIFYLLYVKEFVLPRAGVGDQRISKFLMCPTQLNLSLVFQDYLLYGFSVNCKILLFGLLTFRPSAVFLGSNSSFLNLSIIWLAILLCCNVELIVCSLLCPIIADWLLWCSCLCHRPTFISVGYYEVFPFC